MALDRSHLSASAVTKKMKHYHARLLRSTVISGGAALLLVGFTGWRPAQALTYQTGGVTITLQTTLGYTVGLRTAPVNNETAGLNTDDGDRNFRSGVMANRFQALEQLNIQDGNYGLRASALGWLDTMYLQNNKNNSPNTFNSYGVGNQAFPSQTVANEGRRFEPLAIFLYGTQYFDDGTQSLRWQVGRQTITWGETLFSTDGISGLQAPVDAYQGELLPNPQAQALFLPTGAAALNYNFGEGNSISVYWQFEYEADVLPGVGSYFSGADIVGPGAQRILGTPVNAGAISLYRSPDIAPANGLDQFGISGHTTIGRFGLGAYFVRGIPKAPNIYVNQFAFSNFRPGPAGLQAGQYNIAYAQPVNAYALSFSTILGAANVAGEFSVRTNQPLVSAETMYTSSASYSNPLYPIGTVGNAALSGIDLTGPLPLMPNGIAVESELTVNDVFGVTKNESALTPGRTSEGAHFEITASPTYYPVQNLSVSFPVGWSTSFVGNSQYDATENAGTGTIDVGIKAVYRHLWIMGINYQRYYGSPERQANIDRDFATLYLQRSF
jgi:hypothetical protein